MCLPSREALRLGLTEKFLAEDQLPAGSNGHVRAALSHRRAALAATLCVQPQGPGSGVICHQNAHRHPSREVAACGRLSNAEIGIIHGARIPVQCISGRHDLCAGRFWVSRFADALSCRHILVGESPRYFHVWPEYGASNTYWPSVQCNRVRYGSV